MTMAEEQARWYVIHTYSGYEAMVKDSLEKLIENTDDQMLFAVGDGNHSLATAKECYSINKTENSKYALVEIVNIHDDSLQFEPIYRVVFNVNPEALINDFINKCGGEYNGTDAQKFTCIYTSH